MLSTRIRPPEQVRGPLLVQVNALGSAHLTQAFAERAWSQRRSRDELRITYRSCRGSSCGCSP